MRLQLGTTLVELVVSLVILSITVISLMMVITETGRRSANPMITTQASAIAQSYMEEILSLPLADPDGSDNGSCETGETRATYDDVTDYACITGDNGAYNQAGQLIIPGYIVKVLIQPASIGSFTGFKITVKVTFGTSSIVVPLVSYRLV